MTEPKTTTSRPRNGTSRGATAAGVPTPAAAEPATPGVGTQPIVGVDALAPPPTAAPDPAVPSTPPVVPAAAEETPGVHATAPVTTRPSVTARRRGPLTRMGPWAPVAGAALGLVIGLVAALLLLPSADVFRERLALVFLVAGVTLLGAAGTLLADEVRLVRRGAREAAVRPAWVEATAGLLNGLTPARLLMLISAFVLYLSAYVGKG